MKKSETKNQKAVDTNLDKAVFGIELNPDLVSQVVYCQSMNRRQNCAHTKDRGEVAGSGKKPWKQKGLGRARAGSKRSPIWRKGGVTFGPRNERNFTKDIPDKMRIKAMLMVLSAKAQDSEIKLVDTLAVKEGKTKEVVNMMKSWNTEGKSVLVITDKYDKMFLQAATNVKNLSIMEARNLNAYDLLSAKYIVLTKEGVESIKKTFVK